MWLILIEMVESTTNIRPSLEWLQEQYLAGNQKPLKDLVLAFKGIKELPLNHHHSYYKIAGYHGYAIDFEESAEIPHSESDFPHTHNICPHGVVIFPTWHRFFILRLEKALQFINPNVKMAYWDEISEESLSKGIPWVLTQKILKFGDEEIENPLTSFAHPHHLRDPRNQRIYKPRNVGTVRFPLCGSYSENSNEEVDKYNKGFPDNEKNAQLLNDFLVKYVMEDVEKAVKDCLKVSNYDNFSNTRSVRMKEVSLETPHNTIHASIGSVQYFIPRKEAGNYPLASGDMGSVPLAAFDPIFFFHHCFIDKVFWEWQIRHNTTKNLPMVGNSRYNISTELRPFKKNETEFYTSADSPNIESLGYNYGPLEVNTANSSKRKALRSAGPGKAWFSRKVLIVSGIDRSLIKGTFVVEAFAKGNTSRTKYYLGNHTVFSRSDVENCENCMETLDITLTFSLGKVIITEENDLEFTAKLRFTPGTSFESFGISPTFSVE